MRAVEEALEITRHLTRWDPAGDDWIKIKQATAAANARRSKLLTRTMVEREQGEGPDKQLEREVWDYPLKELQLLECFLTFADSSLQKQVGTGKDKKLVRPFEAGMAEAAFRAAWNGIKEPELLDEWQELVWEVNPHWAPPLWQPTHKEGGSAPLGAEADAKNSPS